MKKHTKLLSLVLVAVLLCTTLASCGAKPNSDPSEAKKSLEANGYTVVRADSDNLLGAAGLALLETAGIDNVKTLLTGSKGEGDRVIIIYFTSKDAANAEWEDVQAYAKKEADYSSDWVIKKSGDMIYYGSKDAVKAAK